MLHLLLRPEELGVDAREDDPVVARQPQGRGGGDLGRGRKQCIETREEALALRLARRVTKALRGEEGGDSERMRVAKRQVREARQPGLEPVDDVEPPPLQGEGQIRPHADRNADPASPGDGQRRAERDHTGLTAPSRCVPAGRSRHAGFGGRAAQVGAAFLVGAVKRRLGTVEQCPPARDEIGRASRGSENGHLVPERAQLAGEAVDVLVDVVRARPGERSNQTDAETHDSPSVGGFDVTVLAPGAQTPLRQTP